MATEKQIQQAVKSIKFKPETFNEAIIDIITRKRDRLDFKYGDLIITVYRLNQHIPCRVDFKVPNKS